MVSVIILIGIFSGLIAGMGGPGGIPIISLLYSFEAVGTAEVAGTSSTIFFFASCLATLMYYRSGDINWTLVKYLAPISIIGTLIGSYINNYLPKSVFGYLISIIIFLIGANVVYREYKDVKPFYNLNLSKRSEKIGLLLLGLIVGVIGGLFGIGGPAITVPVLLFLGVSSLEAIGAGLTQGLVITSSTSINYLIREEINFDLFIILGIPFVLSQVIGWYIAHKINPKILKIFLGIMLIFTAPYLLTTI